MPAGEKQFFFVANSRRGAAVEDFAAPSLRADYQHDREGLVDVLGVMQIRERMPPQDFGFAVVPLKSIA